MPLSKSVSPTLENSPVSRKTLAARASLRTWILAARPKTLTAGVIPVLAATALARGNGHVEPWVSVAALLAALAIQIATNFINDYVDHDKGADTAERIGPTRVTQSGLIARNDVRNAAAMMLVLALLAGVPLVAHGGWPILAVGLVSVALAYCYTGGPFPLAYLGLGDIFVVLFFGLIAVGGVYFLQTDSISLDAVVMGLQIGLLSTLLIAINNLRDVHQDAKSAKKTLAVRLGVRFARAEIAVLAFSPFVLQIYWGFKKGLPAFFVPFLVFPLALKIVGEVTRTEPSPAYNRYLAHAAALHTGFGLILSIVLY